MPRAATTAPSKRRIFGISCAYGAGVKASPERTAMEAVMDAQQQLAALGTR